jgi:uncharacterized protein YacL
MGLIILLIVLLLIFLPELLVITLTFLVTILYGIGEFILRLFGKSFDDKKNKK